MLRLFVVLQLALLVCSTPDDLFEKMLAEVSAHPEQTSEQHTAGLRSRVQPFTGDPTVSFLDAEEKKGYELGLSQRPSVAADPDLGESDEPAADEIPESEVSPEEAETPDKPKKSLASELKNKNPFDSKPDPPTSISCYHQLVEDREQAVKLSTELKRASKIAGERYTAKNIVKKEALELSQAAQKDAVAEHKTIMQRRKEYDLHQVQTKATLRHAKAKANYYKKMEKAVEADAAKSKEAFKRYMKYKELYIEASANTARADTLEIGQYKKIAEQNLKAYSELQVKMKHKKQNALGASERYKALSKRYHGMVKQADQMSEQLTTLSAHYQHASARFRRERSRYLKTADEEAAAAARQKGAAQESQENTKLSESLQKRQIAAKRRYWELLEMIDKYTAGIKEAQTISEMQSIRWSHLDTKLKRLEAEEAEGLQEAKTVHTKMETAQEASKVFLQNYKDSGCASDDADTMLSKNAQQKAAAEHNRKTENPLDAATKPSNTAVLYRDLYSKFRTQYTDALSKDTVKLGEKTYSKCQYFTRLANMYGQLLDVHQTLTQHAEKQSQLRQKLDHQQNVQLNEERVEHYTKLMNRACARSGSRRLQSAIELGEQSDGSEEDAEALKAESCERFKEVATSNMEAAETAKVAITKHAEYMKMLHDEVKKAKADADDAASKRDGAKVRIERFEKIVKTAKQDVQHPC